MPSGGLLIQITMIYAPSGIGLPWIGYGGTPQIIGFTTADNDTTQTLDGTNAIIFQHGILNTDAIERTNALDISGGKGGLATALSGAISMWDPTGTAAAAWLAGTLPLLNATVYRAWMNSAGTIYKQDQMMIQAVDPSGGKITCKLDSLLFVNTPQLSRTRVATQISVDPYDPQNPVDPNYQLTAPVTQIAQNAGFAFGSRRVALKSINPLVAQKIPMFGWGAYYAGPLSALNVNPIVITTATLYHKPGTVDVYEHSGTFVSTLAWLDFVLEPDFDSLNYPNGSTDLANLKARILQFVNAGYRIVASDGTWFADLNCANSWTTQAADFRFENGATYQICGNLLIGDMTDNNSPTNVERTIMRAIATTINPDNSNGPYNIPPSGLDPTQCCLYAVPSQLAVSGNQTNFRGLGSDPLAGVTNTDTATFGIQAVVDGSSGVVIAQTPQSSPDGYMAAVPIINAHIRINQGGPGLTPYAQDYADSVFIWANNGAVLSLTSVDGIGNTSNINENPNTLAATPQLTFGVTGLHTPDTEIIIALMLQFMDIEAQYDYFQVSSSFVAQLQCLTGETSGVYTLTLGVIAPGETGDIYQGGIPQNIIPVRFTGGVSGETHNFSIVKQASPLPVFDWMNATKNFSDLQGEWGNVSAYTGRAGIRVYLNEVSVPSTAHLNAHLALRDMILWGFTKISGSNPDVVVWPFGVTDPVVGFADYGDPAKLLGVAGNKTYRVTPIDYDLAWNLLQDLTSDADGLNTLQGVASLKCNYGHPTGYVAAVGTNDSGKVYIWLGPASAPGVLTKIACPYTYSGTVSFFGGDTPNGTTGTPPGTAFWVGFSDGSIAKFIPSSPTAGTWTNLGSAVAGAKVNGLASDGSSAWHFVLQNGHIYEWNGSSGSNVSVDSYLNGIGYEISTSAFLAVGASGVWRKTSGAYALVHARTFGFPFVAANNGAVVVISQSLISQSTDGGATWVDLPNLIMENSYAGLAVFQGASGASGYLGHTIAFQGSSCALSAATTDFSRWIPCGNTTPEMVLEWVRQRYLGGANGYNPLQLAYGLTLVTDGVFGATFDPPAPDQEGVRVDQAIEKIFSEFWYFAGENASTLVDGSADVIQQALPDLVPGDLADVCTLLTINFQNWAGSYLRQAYIRNVDVAWDPTRPTFFFSGWDPDGWNAPANSPYTSTQGYAIWLACRTAYQQTGILFEKSLNYDTIHDPWSLGQSWSGTGGFFGARINWLCKQPRYLKITVFGNDSASALANAGCVYKANQTMLAMRGLSVPTYGIVTHASHNLGTGIHQLEIAFQPA
jgi:hypothetical protein